MNLCNNCKNYWSNGKGMDECTLYNKWVDSIKECDDFTSKHKQTNADRIRAMTNEELAEILHNAGGNWYSEEYWLNWLKEEAEEYKI